MEALHVYRLAYDELLPVGVISKNGSTFSYDPSYLACPSSIPLSLSLPLQNDPFEAATFRPYFEGLLSEGMARRALAAELQLPEEDYLGLLAQCGRDCIGDVVITTEPVAELNIRSMSYEAISIETFRHMMLDFPEAAQANASSRLSLAGTQNKIGLAHLPNTSLDDGWLRPQGYAATTHILKTSHIRDLPEIEFLCMRAAKACGIPVPTANLIVAPNPILAVERFDRSSRVEHGDLCVERIHQEDLSQAFGTTPGSKYAELPGGSVRAIAELIRRRAVSPARDLATFAKILLFSYAIGNCDGHLKNFSISLHEPKPGRQAALSLEPAYDLVCTTIFPRFSRDMGMKMGGVRSVDDVVPSTFDVLANELGITKRALQRFTEPVVKHATRSIAQTGEGLYGDVLESTPYIAEDLVEDMRPRLAVLQAFLAA